MSAGGSQYRGPFAAFYDRYGTGWTRAFVPALVSYLDTRAGPPGSLIDLACGTGVAAERFLEAGWRVTGLDQSPDMLAIAEARLWKQIGDGRASLAEADARTFTVDEAAAACVCLEGALNHLDSASELGASFLRVAKSLRPGGVFVFDLYEPAHFRGWHRISAIDNSDAVVLQRGVWDEAGGIGMLRISGLYEVDGIAGRVDQTVTSRVFAEAVVREQLSAAGLRSESFDLPVPECACGLGDPGCRAVYVARLPA
jgi:SAM-dependent methyltransferase